MKETEEKLKETHEKYLAANEELLEWNEEVNQLNNQLNKLNQHYSLISEYSSDLVTSYDNQLNLTYVSDSVLPFLGYTPEEYQSLKISEVIHPNDYYPLLRLIASLMVSANRPHFVECRLKHKNNGFSRVELTAQIINNEKSKYIIVNHRNINKRKNTENQLKNNEEQFRALYNHAPLPYQSLKKEGVLSDVNPAWLNQLGYKKENVIGKPFKDLLHPESQINFQERFPQFKANGSISEIEFKIRHHYMSSNSQ